MSSNPNPIEPLWAATFGVGRPPADALQRLSMAYGLGVVEAAPAPQADSEPEPEAPRPRSRKATPKTHTP